MKSLRAPALAEIIFDLVYLFFGIIAGIILLAQANGRQEIVIYGWMTLVLAGGDSFHLIPRVYAHALDDWTRFARPLGFGRLITSITMTIFYLFLYLVWGFYYQSLSPILTTLVLILVTARILLCLFPQNGWFSPNPSFWWAFFRNLPFCLLGALVAVLFASSARVQTDMFRFLWLAITLSFLFYIPVVFLSNKYPKVGMLMLPKTCCYVWIILMGMSLL